jgi:hypothetical protein
VGDFEEVQRADKFNVVLNYLDERVTIWQIETLAITGQAFSEALF